MDIPRGGVYVVLGEMQTLLTAMKKNNKWSSSSHQDDSHSLLVISFMDLKKELNQIGDLQELEPNRFLNPFLEVIRSEETTSPVTSLALSAVNKFLSYSLIDRNTEHLAATVNNIANAVTHAKFVGTDQAQDALVLMRILQVLRTLMLSPSGTLLTNKIVCDIMLSFFRICFELRLNDLLRISAENTLKEVVQLLFTRLPTFSEDPKRSFNSRKLKMRAGSLDGDSKYKTKKKKLQDSNNTNNQTSCNDVADTKPNGKVLDMQGTILNSPTCEVEKPLPTEEDKLAVVAETKDDIPSEGNKEAAMGTGDVVIMIEDEPPEPQVEVENVVLPVPSQEDSEITEKKIEDSNQGEAKEEQEVKIQNHSLEEKEIINHQGVRFSTATAEPPDDRDEPYGLPCVVELIRMLASLVNPTEKQNFDAMMQTGLALTTVALEVGADAIAKFPSLLTLVADDLSRSLFSLLSCEKVPLFAANVQVCFLLFESMRTHLKFQFQLFLSRLMEIIQTDPPKVTYEMKELSLETVVQLWRIPGLVTELYLNYDCDLYAPNLYEDLANLLSKNAYPVGGINNTHLLSLDALLTVIEAIEAHCHSRILNERQQSEMEGKKADSLLVSPSTGLVRKGYRQASADVPTHEEIMAIKTKKKLMSTGTEQFNSKAKRGVSFLQERGILSSPADPAELATFLRENPHLDKKAIGEFISSRNNLDVLDAFVCSFDFANTRIDEALRLYLESFRLPGESPLISLVLEHFAEHWHKSNNEPFANADAAFTLAYAVIMLNVDQHNHNVKKQNIPMTCEEFKKNLKDVNGGANFEERLLDDIYDSIKSSEIVMPAEQTGAVRENYIWKTMLRRGAGKDGLYAHAPPGMFDHSLFSVAWSPTVAALSALYSLYDKTSDLNLCQKCITGFRKCAMISAHYGMHNNLDNLIVSLCKFTNLLSSREVNNEPKETPENITVMFVANPKAMLAVKEVFNLAHRHGDVIRDSWRNILDCLLQLYKCKLLPKILVEADDFIEMSGKISLMRDNLTNQMNQKTEHGLFSSLYLYLSPSETNSKGPSAEEQEAITVAKHYIRECHLEQLVTESKFLRFDSLQHFIKALIRASYGPEGHVSLSTSSYSEGTAVFFLELLLKVVITNRDRIDELWLKIKEHLYTLMMGAAACNHQFLVKRCVVGLLMLAIRLMRKEEMGPTVLQSLRMLLLLKSLGLVARDVAYGMFKLLTTSAANIHAAADWAIIFTLLECVGAGAPPPRVVSKSAALHSGAKSEGECTEGSPSPDRGYTSDSEISRVGGSGASSPDLPQPAGWIMVGKEGEIQPVTGAGGRVPPPDLDRELGSHDPAALVKCCDALSFLVRDVAHITPYNFDNCVHCIRTFVQATLNQNERKTSSHKKTKDSTSKRRFRRQEPETTSYDADESDAEDIPNGYSQVCIQLLDVMHTLHTRTAQIYRWWAEEDGGVAEHMSPWRDGWCPLLQGIATLCSHPDRQVRMSAITYLQRALLVSDLGALTGAEWESCFTRVLFPLLGRVLQPGLDAPDETRIRAATVLSKVFLHHLTPLQSLPSFLELWMTILDFMDKYMHADNSDLLLEAVPESLKNMLLVMDSAEMFTNSDGSRNELWALTWDRISSFLPGLQLDLFRAATSEIPTIDPEPKLPVEKREESTTTEPVPIERTHSTEAAVTSSPESHGIVTASLMSSSPETWQPPPSMFPHMGQVLSTPAEDKGASGSHPFESVATTQFEASTMDSSPTSGQIIVPTAPPVLQTVTMPAPGHVTLPMAAPQMPVPGHVLVPMPMDPPAPVQGHAPVPGHATALPVYSGFSNSAPRPGAPPGAHFFYQDIPQPQNIGSSQPTEIRDEENALQTSEQPSCKVWIESDLRPSHLLYFHGYNFKCDNIPGSYLFSSKVYEL